MILEKDIQVLDQMPNGFNPTFEVSALYLNVGSNYLYLQKGDQRNFKGQWSVPAGKREADESLEKALTREVFEETGIQLNDFAFLKSLYVRYPEFDFVFHPFISIYTTSPKIQLSDEHKAFKWLPLAQAKSLDLIPGGRQIIEMLFD